MLVQDLKSFFERCPSLEFIQIQIPYLPRQPASPPRKRVPLAALKELRLDETASASGLLDHLILPRCTQLILKGQFTGAALDRYGFHAARIHSSSIDHLPVTTEITKVVAMPNSCILSGPNGDIRLWCPEGCARGNFDAEFLTSLSPIHVLEIKELWVGHSTMSSFYPGPWLQGLPGIRGAFAVLPKVEDLTIVGCVTEPFFTALNPSTTASSAGMDTLLPVLRKLTVYVAPRDLNICELIRCMRVRKRHSRPLGKVAIVFMEEVGVKITRKVELLREFVEVLEYYVGEAPALIWKGVDREDW